MKKMKLFEWFGLIDYYGKAKSSFGVVAESEEEARKFLHGYGFELREPTLPIDVSEVEGWKEATLLYKYDLWKKEEKEEEK